MGDDRETRRERGGFVNGPGDTTNGNRNLVFMQYERSRNDEGEIIKTPLPSLRLIPAQGWNASRRCCKT